MRARLREWWNAQDEILGMPKGLFLRLVGYRPPPPTPRDFLFQVRDQMRATPGFDADFAGGLVTILGSSVLQFQGPEGKDIGMVAFDLTGPKFRPEDNLVMRYVSGFYLQMRGLFEDVYRLKEANPDMSFQFFFVTDKRIPAEDAAILGREGIMPLDEVWPENSEGLANKLVRHYQLRQRQAAEEQSA